MPTPTPELTKKAINTIQDLLDEAIEHQSGIKDNPRDIYASNIEDGLKMRLMDSLEAKALVDRLRSALETK